MLALNVSGHMSRLDVIEDKIVDDYTLLGFERYPAFADAVVEAIKEEFCVVQCGIMRKDCTCRCEMPNTLDKAYAKLKEPTDEEK